MAEGANGHEVREFYRSEVNDLVLPKKTPSKRVSALPKPPRSQKKESATAVPAPTEEGDDEATGDGHGAGEKAPRLFCVFNLRNQLDSNNYVECDAARCKYDHLNIRDTSKEELLTTVADSGLGARQRAKLLDLVNKTAESKFQQQHGGKKSNKKRK
jgi:hypothetical protein